jgi:hypothetical protein
MSTPEHEKSPEMWRTGALTLGQNRNQSSLPPPVKVLTDAAQLFALPPVTSHLSLITISYRAVSSVVEHLVYTERVGGSKPSPPSLHSQRRREGRLSRRSFKRRRTFLPCDVNAASFDSACQPGCKSLPMFTSCKARSTQGGSILAAHSTFVNESFVITTGKCGTLLNAGRGESRPT